MNSKKILFRDAVVNDIDPIIRLWEMMMDEHRKNDARIRLADGSLEAYRAYVNHQFHSKEGMVMVAQGPDNSVVAYCLAIINRNLPVFCPPYYGYLSDLFVVPGWRRKGIATALVGQVSKWLKSQDIATIQLQYYEFNVLGELFWNSQGFTPYYTRMWLDLEKHPGSADN